MVEICRSFDMSVQEALEAKDQELSTIDGWVSSHIQELERQLEWEKMRLTRLREMKAYFAITPPRNGILREATRDDSFNIWNFGAVTDLSPEEVQALHLLAEMEKGSGVSRAMPRMGPPGVWGMAERSSFSRSR